VGFLLGMWAWHLTNKTAFFAAALVLFTNWPWTIFVMLPVNKRLQATPRDNADAETRALLRKWNYLHGVRTFLGFVSALAFLLGIATK